MSKSEFVIKRSSDGQFYFNLVAGNGEVIATSELYTRLESCERGIKSVKKNAGPALVNKDSL